MIGFSMLETNKVQELASGICLFFRATPMVYGSSQARDPIGAVAASLRHSHSNKGPMTYATAHGHT